MPKAKPGEVWLVDLGFAAKTRPCLVLSDYPADDELALMVLVPHTTAVRNNRWELAIPKSLSQARRVPSATDSVCPRRSAATKTWRTDCG